MTTGISPKRTAVLAALAEHLLPENGLPGARSVRAAELLELRSRTWTPAVAKRVDALVQAWELSPWSAGKPRFTRLDRAAQRAWVERCYRSRAPWRRLLISALKQLVFLEWASAPAVEEALGYDYRCRRDDEPHGTERAVSGEARPVAPEPEPADYMRRGPAVAQGAIPMKRALIRDFVPCSLPPLVTREWPDLEAGRVERAAVAVIGSGAGGAVVAATLAEAGLDVLVLEEGGRVDAETDFKGPMFDRFQRFCRDNGTTQVWGSPPIPLPIGKVVGGTTVVNSGTCFRAPARVLRQWLTEHGVAGASHDELEPYYEEVEDFLNVRPVPWSVLGPNGTAAHRGAVALGLSGGPLLRNIADCHGCGQCAFGCPTNAKQAMHVSYLPRAQQAGARVYSRCRVEAIEHSDGRATALDVALLDDRGRKRGRMRVLADTVVVCAGAVHTPALLLGSGIPDASGQTGRNLRIHPATGVGGFFSEDVVTWKGTLQSYYIDTLFDSHEVMFEATSTIPSIGAGSVPGLGASAMEELADLRRLATLGFYVSDTSSGRVRRLRTGEALATYRLNELDSHRLAVGIAMAAEVLLAAGATRVYPGLPGIDSISAREDLEQLRQRRVRPEHLKLTGFHPMGTARMGSDPTRSVVDAYGRHHGLSNLWIADASIFPSCVGVNPQMTIMAFARRTGEAIAAAS